jgi:hypothetical protein
MAAKLLCGPHSFTDGLVAATFRSAATGPVPRGKVFCSPPSLAIEALHMNWRVSWNFA